MSVGNPWIVNLSPPESDLRTKMNKKPWNMAAAAEPKTNARPMNDVASGKMRVRTSNPNTVSAKIAAPAQKSTPVETCRTAPICPRSWSSAYDSERRLCSS
eukprot:Amastigsp_a509315_3.p7 type:complete len:101 gc:universal Amastigsp_a509315_3:323-21(-)